MRGFFSLLCCRSSAFFLNLFWGSFAGSVLFTLNVHRTLSSSLEGMFQPKLKLLEGKLQGNFGVQVVRVPALSLLFVLSGPLHASDIDSPQNLSPVVADGRCPVRLKGAYLSSIFQVTKFPFFPTRVLERLHPSGRESLLRGSFQPRL